MPHTIAPKPDYAVSFWKKHKTVPPTRDVFSLLKGKIEYRLEKGVPDRRGKVARCDARHASSRFRKEKGKVAAIITSPPYLNVTSFEEDQWLRLWFLGGDPWPTYSQVSRDDRHRGVDNYFTFLKEVWGGIAPLMKKNAFLVCRIGTRKFRRSELRKRLTETVRHQWSRAVVLRDGEASELQRRQTNAFRPGATGCGVEYDFMFRLGN